MLMIQPHRMLHAVLAVILPFGLVAGLGAEPRILRGVPVPVDARVVAAQPVLVTEADTPFPGRWVALTFDDGPDPRFTPAILSLLEAYQAVATFCLVGSQIPGNEAIVQRIVDGGMRVCSHTRTHDVFLPDKPLEQITDEIVGTQAAIVAAGRCPVSYYRAPGGNWSQTVQDVAAEHGMQPLGWSVDTRDWTRPGVAAVVTQVQQEVRPGSVILLHDGGGEQDETVVALAQLLPWLVKQGYRFGFPAQAPGAPALAAAPEPAPQRPPAG